MRGSLTAQLLRSSPLSAAAADKAFKQHRLRLASHASQAVFRQQRSCPRMRRQAPTAQQAGAAGPPIAPVVTVQLNKLSGKPGWNPHKMGAYRSEEKDGWEQIYDPAHTLRPLKLVSNRIQLSLQDTELDESGAFIDPAKTQFGIIQKIAEAGVEDIFITVGYPWTNASRQFISQGFPDGWEEYWRRCYTTVADALAGPYWTGKPVWVEIFGEPDLDLWSWIYGDEAHIQRATQIAYEAFSRYNDKFRIGGCGFAFPEGNWVKRFLDFYKSSGMKFDFLSFHHYLGWADSTDPAGYPFSNDWLNLSWRNGAFLEALRSKNLGDIPVLVSEYAWYDGDVARSAGFREPEKSAREAITHHQNCARTLQCIDIIINEPSIQRAYFAQGVGNVNQPQEGPEAEYKYLYSYDPFCIFNQYTGTYHYKASYYAFWVYGNMQGRRVRAKTADPALGVWGCKTVKNLRAAIWNRSKIPRSAALELPNTAPDCPCTMYLVDEKTFVPSAGGLEAVISGPTSPAPPKVASVQTVADAVAYLAANLLGSEATVYLNIKQ